MYKLTCITRNIIAADLVFGCYFVAREIEYFQFIGEKMVSETTPNKSANCKMIIVITLAVNGIESLNLMLVLLALNIDAN
jgi:hypothetical protein